MNKYVFKPYDKIFPSLFEMEKSRISNSLKVKYKIEHIGSTAVPGLGGKAIIDIMIAVNRGMMKDALKTLEKIGYVYRPKASNDEKIFLRIDLPDDVEQKRRYHMHLTYLGSSYWKTDRAFRDYLIKNPEFKQKYAKAKQNAAKRANGVKEKYQELKDPVFKEFIHSMKVD